MTNVTVLRTPFDPSPYGQARRRLRELVAEMSKTLPKEVILDALSDRLISMTAAELAKPDLAQLAADTRFLEAHTGRAGDIIKQAHRVLDRHA